MENLDDTLDKMVNLLEAYEEIPFLDLVQHVWRQGWLLELATAPQDDAVLKQALKACLLERMAEIWNAPPKNSNEKVPGWCESIPALTVRFSVIKQEEQEFWKNELSSPVFAKRNIFAPKEFMFFL